MHSRSGAQVPNRQPLCSFKKFLEAVGGAAVSVAQGAADSLAESSKDDDAQAIVVSDVGVSTKGRAPSQALEPESNGIPDDVSGASSFSGNVLGKALERLSDLSGSDDGRVEEEASGAPRIKGIKLSSDGNGDSLIHSEDDTEALLVKVKDETVPRLPRPNGGSTQNSDDREQSFEGFGIQQTKTGRSGHVNDKEDEGETEQVKSSKSTGHLSAEKSTSIHAHRKERSKLTSTKSQRSAHTRTVRLNATSTERREEDLREPAEVSEGSKNPERRRKPANSMSKGIARSRSGQESKSANSVDSAEFVNGQTIEKIAKKDLEGRRSKASRRNSRTTSEDALLSGLSVDESKEVENKDADNHGTRKSESASKSKIIVIRGASKSVRVSESQPQDAEQSQQSYLIIDGERVNIDDYKIGNQIVIHNKHGKSQAGKSQKSADTNEQSAEKQDFEGEKQSESKEDQRQGRSNAKGDSTGKSEKYIIFRRRKVVTPDVQTFRVRGCIRITQVPRPGCFVRRVVYGKQPTSVAFPAVPTPVIPQVTYIPQMNSAFQMPLEQRSVYVM